MKLEVKVEGGVLQWCQMPEGFRDGTYEIDIRNLDTYTRQQHRALFLWMTLISNKLNSLNITTAQVLKPNITWTADKVRYTVLQPVLEAVFNTKTTTKLKKQDFDLLINTIVSGFASKGISIPDFPTQESKETR